MSRRLDVELTSDKGDGTLTWRAAGAREPRGVLAATLLPAGVKVGDTVKVDADYDMDGVTIVSVLPPAATARAEPERIEIIGPPPPPPRDYSKEPERRERKPRRGDRPGRDGGRPGRGERRDRGDRSDRGPRGERPDRPHFERPEKPKLPPKPKPPRLRAGRAHRQALLDGLPVEQRPVAEQVLKGGIPAVRDAIAEQNAAAEAAGQPPVKADALLSLAESLVPQARVAEWQDRAEAAIEQIDVVDLRDLRSVVTKAESAARDESSRELADRLRAGLVARLEREQLAWMAEIDGLLADDRVVRALNESSRPPKAGTPLPRELAERLAAAAGSALTDQIGAKRWSTVLEALALSPVHAQVTPASIPSSPSDELLAAVKVVSMQVPQIAALFGIEPTPAPRSRGPRGGARGKPRATPATGTAPKGGGRIPPPPRLEEAAATPAPEAEASAAEPEAPAESAPAAEAPAVEAEPAEVEPATGPEVAAVQAPEPAGPKGVTPRIPAPATPPAGAPGPDPQAEAVSVGSTPPARTDSPPT